MAHVTPAWGGELLLLESKWTDKDGHTVRFKLATPNEARPNPFKQFTKRRGDRAGTRFAAAMRELETNEDAYVGEVMLMSWGDTSTQGYTVGFWVEAPEQGVHAFERWARNTTSFFVSLVELDEDDSPVDTHQRARVEKATGTEPVPPAEGGEEAESAPAVDARLCNCEGKQIKDCQPQRAQALAAGVLCRQGHNKPGRIAQQVEHPSETRGVAGSTPAPATMTETPVARENVGNPDPPKPRREMNLANYAAMLCDNEAFWRWINVIERRDGLDRPYITDRDMAAAWMRARLNIDSRKELADESIARRYHEEIRKPFVAWQEEDSKYETA